MMMKPKPHPFMVAAMLVSLGCVLLELAALFWARPWDVPLERLLLDETNFPTTWDSDMGVVTVSWKPSDLRWVRPPDSAFHSAANLGRRWSDGGKELGPARVTQTMYLYNSVQEAMLWYWVSRPEHAYWYKLPNFTFRGLEAERYPAHWGYHSASADQELVVCAMGRLAQCQNWIYWARYGQYIMDVGFFAANQWIAPELFQRVVAQMDAHVTEQLAR